MSTDRLIKLRDFTGRLAELTFETNEEVKTNSEAIISGPFTAIFGKYRIGS